MPFDRRTFLAGFGGAAASGVLGRLNLPLSPLWSAQGASGPIVETSAGRVRGTTVRGVHTFKGIPYGASTAGANRFMAPQPPTPWTGVLDAHAYGPDAPQLRGGSAAGSEDCLKLNVWTRGLGDAARRPVMVWLHGGGFSSLSASSPMYDGVNLCLRGDVVIVSLNHRLNVFGYLHLGDLAGSRWAVSANAGMLDIVQALAWVRDHIARFGGDPGNVTIFGESGGGRKVSTLLAMPDARGLFHRAIIQSGPGLHLQPRDKSTEIAIALLREVGLSPRDVPRLQELPMDRLLAAYEAVEGRLDGDAREKGLFEQRGFVPTVGLREFPRYAFDPGASDLSANVPILIGTNKHEAAWAARSDRKIHDRTLTEAELRARVEVMVGRAAGRVLELYAKAYPNTHPAVRWILMVTDRTYRFDSIALAQRKAAAGGAPVFMYLFAWETPVLGGRLLAHHALELTFVFDNTTQVAGMSGGGPAAAALAAKMSEAWIAFARSGTPSTPNLPPWPPYTADTRSTMLFNDTCAVVNDPGGEERHLWATI